MSSPSIVMLGCHSVVGQLILDMLDFSEVTGLDCSQDRINHPKISEFIQADLAKKLDASLCRVISKADIILMTTPFSCFEAFSCQIISLLKKDVLLIDTFSIKSPYIKLLKVLEREKNKKFSLLSLNPLFRPDAKLHNKKICVCVYHPTDLTQSLIRKLSESLEVIKLESLEEHDKIMGIIQAAPHFSMLVLSMFLKNSGLSFEKIHSMKTVFMEGTLAVLSRLLMGQSHVYWDIQANNDYAKESRDQLSLVFDQLSQMVCENDNKAFNQLFEELKDFFKDNEAYNRAFFKLLHDPAAI